MANLEFRIVQRAEVPLTYTAMWEYTNERQFHLPLYDVRNLISLYQALPFFVALFTRVGEVGSCGFVLYVVQCAIATRSHCMYFTSQAIDIPVHSKIVMCCLATKTSTQ